MAEYEVVIGLEVHARLSTESKLFCACSAGYGSEPNTQVCPVCGGMPGALPVVNARAVEYAARAGMALNCTVRKDSVFARKNYFYPDLPNGYQISQFELPICEGGYLDIDVDGVRKRVGLTRIHMENDAGKNIHAADASYVDLNRAGTPLIEIVSEPDMRSAEEAVAYLRGLHAIVTTLGVCDGNMEEGSFRCDANVSIRPRGQEAFGTRTELKNLNSFRNVQRAIEYEISRQQDVIEDGESVVQETRLYDSVKNITQSMRGKEEAHDYRYFPDPDLLPVTITDEQLAGWRVSQPELPEARTARLMAAFELPEQDARLLTSDRALADMFETACGSYGQPRKILNLMTGPLLRALNERNLTPAECSMKAEALAELARIVDEGVISAKIASDVFGELFESGAMPEAFVRERGLVQVSDTGAIEQAVAEALAASPKEVEAYKGGKTKLMGFFVGQVMRTMKGKANPAVLNEILEKKLAE